MFTFLFPKFHVRDVFGIVAIAAVVLFVQIRRRRKPQGKGACAKNITGA
jgi:hypothetical protein